MKKNISLKGMVKKRIYERFGFSGDECEIIANELIVVLNEYVYNTEDFVIANFCSLINNRLKISNRYKKLLARRRKQKDEAIIQSTGKKNSEGTTEGNGTNCG
jgi:hypothetical protein